jgi:hypothetical protein
MTRSPSSQDNTNGDEKAHKKRARKDFASDSEETKRKEGKVKKRKTKSKRNNTDSSTSPAPQAESVHLDSLQSIFAPKSASDAIFTLFGGDPVEEPLPYQVAQQQVAQQSVAQQSVAYQPKTQPQQPQRASLYFFPHYDSPEKNALSLFPEPKEPFFHNRTE